MAAAIEEIEEHQQAQHRQQNALFDQLDPDCAPNLVGGGPVHRLRCGVRGRGGRNCRDIPWQDRPGRAFLMVSTAAIQARAKAGEFQASGATMVSPE